ncbi:hypothetical protein RKD49_000840 [Streptomyces glaucescens]
MTRSGNGSRPCCQWCLGDLPGDDGTLVVGVGASDWGPVIRVRPWDDTEIVVRPRRSADLCFDRAENWPYGEDTLDHLRFEAAGRLVAAVRKRR